MKNLMGKDVPYEDCLVMKPNKYEYQFIFTHHIEKLKARLLNLADSMTTDTRQAESIKGLIKDFCNLTHLDGRTELDTWAERMKIIDGESEMPVACLDSTPADRL